MLLIPFTVSRSAWGTVPFNKIHLFIIYHQTFILPHKGCSSQADGRGSLSSVDGHCGAYFLVRAAEDSLGLPAFLLGSPYATADVITVQLCLLCAASRRFANACFLPCLYDARRYSCEELRVNSSVAKSPRVALPVDSSSDSLLVGIRVIQTPTVDVYIWE